MLNRLEGGTSAGEGGQCYLPLIDALVIDEADAADAEAVAALGVEPIVTKTLMCDAAARRALAEAGLDAVARAWRSQSSGGPAHSAERSQSASRRSAVTRSSSARARPSAPARLRRSSASPVGATTTSGATPISSCSP